MAFITADRVKDTSTTTGTGNITVSGSAPFGYRTFSTVLSVGDTFYYCIQGQASAEWEIGIGTYASTNQFARTTVLSSSASGSKVSFSSGTKNVFITLAASKTLQLGPSDGPTAGSVPYGTGSTLAYTAAGTAGQVFTSNGTGAPYWNTVTSTGTVTSVNVSGGTTGLTASGGPITSSGTITLAGTLAAANGGTGLTSPGTNGNVLTSNGTGWVSSPASGGSGTVTSVNVSGGTTGLTTSGGPVTTSGTVTLAGTLAIANGGTGQTTASAAFNALSPVTSTGDLIIGNGTNSATRLAIGANNYVLTSNGTTAAWAAISSGSGTVNSGTAGQLSYYSSTGTAVSGNANATISGGALTLGVAGTTAGSALFSGSTSGAVTVKSAAAAGTWSLTLPTSAGTNGYVLSTDGTGVTSWIATSGGGGTVTSINVSGGTTGLTYSGGPITSSGTITMAGTLAVANGGTGVTTSTGSGNNVLSASPTFSGTISFPGSTTIDSSGNVGIGTSSPTAGFKLNISDTTAKMQMTSTTGTSIAYSSWNNTGGAVLVGVESSTGGSIFAGTGAYSAVFGHGGAYPVAFATSNTERMRIDSSGNVLIGTTSGLGDKFSTYNGSNSTWAISSTATAVSGNVYGIISRFSGYNPNSTSGIFFYGVDTTTARFIVYGNGGIANYQANDTNLSDQRLKKNIELAGPYLAKICAIPVKTFLYNDQTDDEMNLGVIAQDVEAVAPELVDNGSWKDKDGEATDYLSIYQTDLQYALMKCIQELSAKNDALEARLAKLENV